MQQPSSWQLAESPAAAMCLGFRSGRNCVMPRFEGGFILLQGKNKKKQDGRGAQIAVWFQSPPGVFQFWLPDGKKKPTQTQENPTVAKKGELEAILCSSASFPVTLIWQHNSLLSPKIGGFHVAKRGWILYMHPQEQVLSNIKVTLLPPQHLASH